MKNNLSGLVDENLITRRKLDDLPAFNKALIKHFFYFAGFIY